MTLHAMIICKGCVIQWVQVYSVIGCEAYCQYFVV